LPEIFLLYPVTGASIAHKLLARGLKTCLGFKNDSMASALDYIASVNASASQLSHVQPMTVQDVYALVTLMGLYLSEASGHQKAYKELLAHIDDSHALTLDKVRKLRCRKRQGRRHSQDARPQEKKEENKTHTHTMHCTQLRLTYPPRWRGY
jgi:hypothetical protein